MRQHQSFAEWIDRAAGQIMIWPAVLILLAFSIFPLLVSAYLTVTRFRLAPGGFELRYVGWLNFKKLLFGSQQYHLLGTFSALTATDWLIFALAAGTAAWLFVGAVRSGTVGTVGLIGRLIAAAVLLALLLLALAVTGDGAFPGTLVVTVFYVLAGVSVQFLLGLGLALLCAQRILGRSVFRVVFFIPLTVTPVGIAYLFRMLADVGKGPLTPLLAAFGLGEVSWAADPWSARLVVLIGDTWQWTPFLFLILLAAVENQPRDQVEAARLDGAGDWQVFRDVTWPAIAPVAATVVLIRLIEAFKIIDLPNILTNGGPGIATESLTLHAFIAWRTQDLGGSAAVGYTLLAVAVVCCVSFFHFVVRRARAHERP